MHVVSGRIVAAFDRRFGLPLQEPAEQGLASANDQYITSLYNHNLAKLSLARALGVARTDYSQYLGAK